ncbi:hypothetical protein A0H81_11904 [Grifola frondosa]|uniref:Uncharacterized protein n=1 Tax=Grifola frondosa TaxID=5627 RepID=A0A1C7LTJ9_GRIFR|nr:hypothetical protein A0H81_11904 [Grifola frondosa]
MSASTYLSQRRAASSDSHDHHHEEYHDNNVYPKEDFLTPFWRNFIIFSAGVVAFYKYAPAPSNDAYLTRWISQYATPAEVLERLGYKHLLLSAEQSVDNLIMADAKRPPVHRYRYPQRFEQYSPHVQPVGIKFDMGDVIVKGDDA